MAINRTAMLQINTLFWRQALTLTPLADTPTATQLPTDPGRREILRQLDEVYALAHGLEQQRKTIRTLSERVARDALRLEELQQGLTGKLRRDPNRKIICLAQALEQRNRRKTA